jgi:cell division protein FtsI (penicillin-binding protein 3)
VAQKIFIDTPIVDEVETLDVKMGAVERDYENFYEKSQKYKTIMPNVVGMPAMDALALLENMKVNVKVRLEGNGLVKAQSINKNTKLKDNQTVVLKAS